MDDAGVQRAYLYGASEGGPTCVAKRSPKIGGTDRSLVAQMLSPDVDGHEVPTKTWKSRLQRAAVRASVGSPPSPRWWCDR